MTTDEKLAVIDIMLEKTHVFLGSPELHDCGACGKPGMDPGHSIWWEPYIDKVASL